MNNLLKRLLGLLFPGVDDGESDVGEAGGDDAARGAAGDDTAGNPPDDEFDIEFVEDTPTPSRGRSAPGNDDVSRRVATLEAEVERRGRLAAEQASRQPAAPDAEFQREEERLRSSDVSEQERWQINANRVLRESQRQSTQALFQALDLSDRTQFEAKVTTDPRREKYRDRVEQAVQEERRNGRNASREAVYFFMLGKDIAEGKLKPKAKARPPAADVPRGRSSNVRSDVNARGARTEQDKRRARLENQSI